MTNPLSWSIGKIYSIDEIRPLVPLLKLITHKSTPTGLFMLYRIKETHDHWIGGPFQGKDSNLFLFMGTRNPKDQTLKVFSEEFAQLWKDINHSGRPDSWNGTFDLDSNFDFNFDFDNSDWSDGDS